MPFHLDRFLDSSLPYHYPQYPPSLTFTYTPSLNPFPILPSSSLNPFVALSNTPERPAEDVVEDDKLYFKTKRCMLLRKICMLRFVTGCTFCCFPFHRSLSCFPVIAFFFYFASFNLSFLSSYLYLSLFCRFLDLPFPAIVVFAIFCSSVFVFLLVNSFSDLFFFYFMTQLLLRSQNIDRRKTI